MREFTREFLQHVIIPVVDQLGFDSGAAYSFHIEGGWYLRPADVLLLGTALAETGLREIEQGRGKKQGPALGYFQMEPSTHDDIWKHFIKPARGKLRFIVAGISDFVTLPPPAERMMWDLRYAAAMCRIHYRRQPGEIPDTIEGIAAYYKQYYNTPLGKGSEETFLEAWNNR